MRDFIFIVRKLVFFNSDFNKSNPYKKLSKNWCNSFCHFAQQFGEELFLENQTTAIITSKVFYWKLFSIFIYKNPTENSLLKFNDSDNRPMCHFCSNLTIDLKTEIRNLRTTMSLLFTYFSHYKMDISVMLFSVSFYPYS